ncbi:hypothetical protein PHMEG_00020768 [Phytophthora megakarya]|uniref:Reverse transcriptase n=1 Tax=Phytophthora megakarya TaxID=4795 RepID=A0A225VPG0_9STRA|nr:hypothetical protein PHMEG_00020768 [Phytophthora megakarya]
MHEITEEVRTGWYDEAVEHFPNEMELTEYEHEFSFLPDLTEPDVTNLDYSSPNVRNPALSENQSDRLVKELKKHEKIMIASGNALPPSAYGVVCDIDVQGHSLIKQKLDAHPSGIFGLLRVGLITISDSPWASPIVIVLRNNSVDIRLCIDYTMVNAVTAYYRKATFWFCSLDAPSEFWASMMSSRAREVSAFVCALGYFEWLRMPFDLKTAPMIYQRMIDNALGVSSKRREVGFITLL